MAVSQRCPKCRRTVKRVSRPPTEAEVVSINATRRHPAGKKRTVKRGAQGRCSDGSVGGTATAFSAEALHRLGALPPASRSRG